MEEAETNLRDPMASKQYVSSDEGPARGGPGPACGGPAGAGCEAYAWVRLVEELLWRQFFHWEAYAC